MKNLGWQVAKLKVYVVFVWANTAASLCVQRPGAGPSMPTAGEVSAAISSPPG